ncbi:MAG: hypothetical protein NTV88_02700 [Candidatus Micrarchaeota archaeon]|nr:hypothetical protein [Candidatus Micrarchaeota archaeon]
MGKIDVISALFESYELIKAHYKEVALPLVILLILSGAGHLGSNWGGNGLGSDKSSALGSGSQGGIANALSSPAVLAGVLSLLLGALLIVLVIFVILALIVALVGQATWFYVFEHFYALLGRKKALQEWKPRFKRLIVKSLILGIFWLVILVTLVAVPVILFIAESPLALPVAIIAVLALLILAFFLQPIWVYFAMDDMKIMDAAGKSMSLVRNNMGSFLLFGFIVLLVSAGGMAASLFITITCCLVAPIVMPFINVFFGLLFGITMMKMKLALEK